MKIFTKKGIIGKLIIVISILIIFSCLIPSNKVYAADLGGVLLRPVMDLILTIADGIFDVVQKALFDSPSLIVLDLSKGILSTIFTVLVGVIVAVVVAAASIALGFALPTIVAALATKVGVELSVGLSAAAIGTIVVTAVGEGAIAGLAGGAFFNRTFFGDQAVLPLYRISPEEIFAGDIPMLNVNFFDSGTVESSNITDTDVSEMTKVVDSKSGIIGPGSTDEALNSEINDFLSKYGFDGSFDIGAYTGGHYNQDKNISAQEIGTAVDEDGVPYVAKFSLVISTNNYNGIGHGTYEVAVYTKALGLIDIGNTLNPTISRWYYALRTIAIVVMLIILVYIGIRIMTSSIASEKSKYKNMLTDWVVAMCLIFVMHYIMVFANNINEAIIEVFKSTNKLGAQIGVILDKDGDIKRALEDDDVGKTMVKEHPDIFDGYENGEGHINWPTNYMGLIRLEAAQHSDAGMVFIGYGMAFLVLWFYTIFFLFTYLRRLVYMAFLTIIAPMVAMTYPIDKINDGKAQAFDIWFKEYIFNLLLQPVHLLLYTILISSACELAETNIIYTLVALGFMMPAEKLLRRFFGFEKAQTPGVLGGAAGAALMMSGLNRLLRPRPPRHDHNLGGEKDSEDENKDYSLNSTGDLMDGVELGAGAGKTDDKDPTKKPVLLPDDSFDKKEDAKENERRLIFPGENPEDKPNGKLIYTPETERKMEEERQRKAAEEAEEARKKAVAEQAKKAIDKKYKEEEAARIKEERAKHPVKTRIKGFAKGLRKSSKYYIEENMNRAIRNYRGRGISAIGRTLRGGFVGAGAAIVGASIGIASGDIGKVGQNASTAAVAGYAVGSRKSEPISEKDAKKIGEEMEKNQYDTPEEYKAAKLKKNVDKIIGNSDNLRTIQENLNLKSYDEAKEKLENYRDCMEEGITDMDDVSTIIKMVEEKKWDKEFAKNIAKASKGLSKRPDKIEGTREGDDLKKKYIKYAQNHGVTNEEDAENAANQIISRLTDFGKTKDNLRTL